MEFRGKSGGKARRMEAQKSKCKGAKVSHNVPWCRVTGTGDGSSGSGQPRRSPERPADRLRRPLVHLVNHDASVDRGKHRSQSESLR